MPINILCFTIPIVLMLPTSLLQNAESLLLFLPILFLTGLYALLKLMFVSQPRDKQAACFHLAGIAVALVFPVVFAYLVNVGQSSPW